MTGGHGFNPWSGKIPRARGQLNVRATTAEARVPYSPSPATTSLCRKPAHHNEEQPLPTTTRESAHTATKDPELPKINIQSAFKSEPRVKVMAYDGLTVDFAAEQQAQFILRGVRSVQDFEYERNIAEANKQLSGIETVLLYTRPEYAHISSTLLRDLHSHGKDISPYLP